MQLKLLSILLMILLFAPYALSQTTTTVAGKSNWHNRPVNNARTNQRLAEYAEESESAGPIPRIALYDIGYPHSLEEFKQLDGHAILMVTSLAHTKDAFPLKRVFASIGSDVYELKMIKNVLSQNSENAKVAKVFGQFRSDSLYLLPFYTRLQNGASVSAEFGDGGKPMQIVLFNSPVGESVRFLPNEKPTGKGPETNFLDVFLRREYPAFFETKE